MIVINHNVSYMIPESQLMMLINHMANSVDLQYRLENIGLDEVIHTVINVMDTEEFAYKRQL